jgi:hypothetical protein
LAAAVAALRQRSHGGGSLAAALPRRRQRHVRYVALLLQHTRTTFSKMEYLEIFLNGKDVSHKYLNCKDVSHKVSKLQRCFSRNICKQKTSV